MLAYSTISQYGYVVVMYGIGGAAGNGAAAFYVLAHGVAKSALFMTAGAVTLATARTGCRGWADWAAGCRCSRWPPGSPRPTSPRCR